MVKLDLSMLKKFATRVAGVASLSIMLSLGSSVYMLNKIEALEAQIKTQNERIDCSAETIYGVLGNNVEDMMGLNQRIIVLEQDKLDLQPAISEPETNQLEEFAKALGY